MQGVELVIEFNAKLSGGKKRQKNAVTKWLRRFEMYLFQVLSAVL
jgi:hypothetical protein